MTINDPALAAANVTLEIADGDRFTTTILVHEADYSDGANAGTALDHALAAMAMRWPGEMRPVRVDVAARWDIHGVEIDVDELELPEGGPLTVVVALSTPFQIDPIYNGAALDEIRRAVQAREEETGVYVYRVIYLVTQQSR